MAPHLRWPNKGFHASNGKKRVFYDELSLPQWISGQLSNIYAISDPTLSKQALLQGIFAMRDTVSLLWPAVRAAWASSMHQMEEGHLSWADSTQWAINSLSASQVALAHTQATKQSTHLEDHADTTIRGPAPMRAIMAATHIFVLIA